MDINKVSVMRPEFKDLRRGLQSQHFSTEVVLIDRTLAHSQPQVYTLKPDVLSSLFYDKDIQYYTADLNNSFAYAGELVEIQADRKLILLTNDNSLTYKHIINTTGNIPSVELTTILHALKNALIMEGLLIHQKMPASNERKRPFTQESDSPEVTISDIPEKYSHSIDKIAQAKMSEKENEGTSPNLVASNKTLCEVKL